MSSFAISQILIAIAFLFDCASFQFKGRRAILACFVASSILIAAHFLILDNLSATGIILVSSARSAVAYYSRAAGWMWVFIAASVVVLAATYSEPLNFLPFIASIIASIASFQANDRPLRIYMMCGTALWIVHNALAGSPAATLLEFFFLISNFIGFWRYYIRGGPAASRPSDLGKHIASL